MNPIDVGRCKTGQRWEKERRRRIRRKEKEEEEEAEEEEEEVEEENHTQGLQASPCMKGVEWGKIFQENIYIDIN